MALRMFWNIRLSVRKGPACEVFNTHTPDASDWFPGFEEFLLRYPNPTLNDPRESRHKDVVRAALRGRRRPRMR